jgi:hypothetical protein
VDDGSCSWTADGICNSADDEWEQWFASSRGDLSYSYSFSYSYDDSYEHDHGGATDYDVCPDGWADLGSYCLGWYSDGSGETYSWMESQCSAQDAELCTFDQLCPNGGPNEDPVGGEQDYADMWVPIAGSDDCECDYVQVGRRDGGTCNSHYDAGWGCCPTTAYNEGEYACCVVPSGYGYTDAPTPASIPPSANTTCGGGICFLLYHGADSADDAEERCVSYGGQLGKIENEEQFDAYDALAATLDDGTCVFFGADIRSGNWTYRDGSATFYMGVIEDSGDPSGTGEECSCFYVDANSAEWGSKYYDAHCDYNYGYGDFFICFFDETPVPTVGPTTSQPTATFAPTLPKASSCQEISGGEDCYYDITLKASMPTPWQCTAIWRSVPITISATAATIFGALSRRSGHRRRRSHTASTGIRASATVRAESGENNPT